MIKRIELVRCGSKRIMMFPQCWFCKNNPEARKAVKRMFRGICTAFEEFK